MHGKIKLLIPVLAVIMVSACSNGSSNQEQMKRMRKN